MTVAVGVGVAGVIMGLMLALGVGLFPGLTGCLLPVATGVGLMLAVGGSEMLALTMITTGINNDSTGVHFKDAPS